jgi:hypothetical protein
MPRYIVKLRNLYLEWSTIVDAPISYGWDREGFTSYYRRMYGEVGLQDLAKRLERVDQYGTSLSTSASELIAGNRAGPNGRSLSEDELYRAYCLRESIDGWHA